MAEDKTPVQDPYDALPGESDLQMNAKTMKAFAHPLRMRMYTFLSDHGSATATRLAEELNESTGQTSYHLRQLEKHGLVEEDTERGSGRERWWKPVGYSLRRHLIQGDAGSDPAMNLLINEQVRDRSEKLRHWLTTMDSAPQEWVEASILSTSTATMTPEQARALTQELMAVLERHTEAAEAAPNAAASDQAQRVRIYLSLFPLETDIVE